MPVTQKVASGSSLGWAATGPERILGALWVSPPPFPQSWILSLGPWGLWQGETEGAPRGPGDAELEGCYQTPRLLMGSTQTIRGGRERCRWAQATLSSLPEHQGDLSVLSAEPARGQPRGGVPRRLLG